MDSKGFYIDRLLYVKSTDDLAEYFFANMLFRAFNVIAPECRIMEFSDPEFQEMLDAMAYKTIDSALRKRIENELRERPFLLLLEYIPNLSLLELDHIRSSKLFSYLKSEKSREVFIQTGRILGLDILINNDVRLPFGSDHPGGPHLLGIKIHTHCLVPNSDFKDSSFLDFFLDEGSTMAIDHKVNCLDPNNKYHLKRLSEYINNVSELLKQLLYDMKAILIYGTNMHTYEFKPFKRIKDFYSNACKYDLSSENCFHIALGLIVVIEDIVRLNLSNVDDLIRYTRYSSIYKDFGDTYLRSSEKINLNYFRYMNSFFRQIRDSNEEVFEWVLETTMGFYNLNMLNSYFESKDPEFIGNCNMITYSLENSNKKIQKESPIKEVASNPQTEKTGVKIFQGKKNPKDYESQKSSKRDSSDYTGKNQSKGKQIPVNTPSQSANSYKIDSNNRNIVNEAMRMNQNQNPGRGYKSSVNNPTINENPSSQHSRSQRNLSPNYVGNPNPGDESKSNKPQDRKYVSRTSNDTSLFFYWGVSRVIERNEELKYRPSMQRQETESDIIEGKREIPLEGDFLNRQRERLDDKEFGNDIHNGIYNVVDLDTNPNFVMEWRDRDFKQPVDTDVPVPDIRPEPIEEEKQPSRVKDPELYKHKIYTREELRELVEKKELRDTLNIKEELKPDEAENLKERIKDFDPEILKEKDYQGSNLGRVAQVNPKMDEDLERTLKRLNEEEAERRLRESNERERRMRGTHREEEDRDIELEHVDTLRTITDDENPQGKKGTKGKKGDFFKRK